MPTSLEGLSLPPRMTRAAAAEAESPSSSVNEAEEEAAAAAEAGTEVKTALERGICVTMKSARECPIPGLPRRSVLLVVVDAGERRCLRGCVRRVPASPVTRRGPGAVVAVERKVQADGVQSGEVHSLLAVAAVGAVVKIGSLHED